jgi:mutator protein MutT
VGLVRRDGRILITRRRSGATFAGFWELPGGGCLPGETPAECVVREVREETGAVVRVERAAPVVTHAYPELTVELHPFVCTLVEGEPRPLESQALAWVAPHELGLYRFPEANRALFLALGIT